MTDAVAVFDPGTRLTDSTDGSPLSGAVIRFYDAGTTNPKIVYADADLLTELGTSVTTDSLGYPTSNGTTKTLVYLGTAAYKVRIETSTGVEIVTHDNVKGAVVSDTGSSAAVNFTSPVVTKSLDYTVLAADQSKFIKVNCASADVTLTLPSAVTVGDGWFIEVQQIANSNQALIATVSSQTISRGGKSYGTSFSMTNGGEYVWLVSNGGNWDIKAYAPPFFTPGVGVISVTDRLATSPGSPVQGSVYLATGNGGSWSTGATNDLWQYTGAGWINFTPYTDCGWIAFVQDEDLNYQFQGSAWVVFPAIATTAVSGISQLADAAAMEAKTASRTVTADIQHRHPLMPKAWGVVTYSGGVPTLAASHGVSGITDTGTGQLTVTWSTAFSSTSYAVLAAANDTGGGNGISRPTTLTTTTVLIETRTTGGGSLTDPVAIHFAAFGDQ